MIPAGVLIVAGIIALAGLVIIGHPPWFALPFGLIYGAPAAIYGAIRVMRGVDYNEPLRHKIATACDEFGRQSRQSAETVTHWQMPWPNLHELPDSAERQLRVDQSAGECGSTGRGAVR